MARRRRRLTGSAAVPLDEVARRFGEDPADPARAAATRRFPARWTRYYLDLADPDDERDPIRRIAFPDPLELEPHAEELADPVGERERNPAPFVVRKHADRAILLVTARCHVYCRFCFRRAFPDGAHRDPDDAQLEAAFAYLESQPDLREVILSGGDPLVLPDEELGRIVERLSSMAQLTRIRVHSRAPVHDPARVTVSLVEALTAGLPLWFVIHADHPREITDELRAAVGEFRRAGVPVLNQSVLLAGVNDDPATLESLCRKLVDAQIVPYYLHHPDRVPGAGSFYLDIERGRAIHRELRRRLGGGIALPSYVIDPPDGSGKRPLG